MSISNALIGNLTKIRTGKLDANAADPAGKYPFFTCAQEPLAINRYAYDCDAILVAGNGDLNVKHYKGKFEAYQRTYIIKVANESKLDSRYLYYFMSKYVEKLRELSIGGVIKYIKLGMLTDAEIPLPLLPEQKRIAAILDKADAIRRKRQAAIKLADEFLRATFLDMFGDPVTNPKGWEVKPIGEMLTFLTSGSRGWAKFYSNDGALFLRIQNIGKNELILEDVAFVNPPESAEARRTRVMEGDVLLSITADLGRTAIIPKELPVAHINQHLAILRFKGVEPLYSSAFLASPGGQEQIKKLNREGVKAGLNFDNVRSLEMMLPPELLQKKWTYIYEKKMQQNRLLQNASGWDTTLFNSLTQRAFRGKL
ncbi:MAG: restriction endonuclease subunit S [Candidatus Omnitrophica bacterium]|nr:restriction endonuclease subunit S [Candidatus Omnitrophota bacterium]